MQPDLDRWADDGGPVPAPAPEYPHDPRTVECSCGYTNPNANVAA